MSALDKTKTAIRTFLPPNLLDPNQSNPNRMSDKEFDMLCDNLDRTGMTDPILLRPNDRKQIETLWAKCGEDNDAFVKGCQSKSIRFNIVGGHHRHKAAVFLEFDVVPVVIIMAEDFDDDQEKFQLVRMNMIHGKLDAQAFIDLYQSLTTVYSDEVLQEAFGFSDEREFQRIVNQMAKTLPDKDTQAKFKKAVAQGEIKTVDGLTKILNEMFTKYGNTLEHGYMVFDFNNQKSVWLRIEGKTMKALEVIGEMCAAQNRSVDDVVGSVLQQIAIGETPTSIAPAVAKTGWIKIPKKMTLMPTKDNLENAKELA